MLIGNLKNPVKFSWLNEEGARLDAPPFLSDALEARFLLKQLRIAKQPLGELTAGHNGGIYNGPMFSRSWVDNPASGVPFVGSSDMLLASLSQLPLLNKRLANSSKLRFLRLEEGMSLISCSGTIGRTVYVRPDMAGMWSSQHIMKVVPNRTVISPGYLYAFLSGKYGKAQVTAGTYGAIIQHIEPQHIANLQVPRLDKRTELKAHRLVEEAAHLRTAATQTIDSAIQVVVRQLTRKSPVPGSQKGRPLDPQVVWASSVAKKGRLEGFYYNRTANELDKWALAHPNGHYALGDIARVFDVPPFKHIYVEASYGVPFFTSGEIFQLDRIPDKYLSKTQTVNLHKYILESGWVLLARSGQLGGIIGKPQFADSAMNKAATSDHVIRIVSKGVVPPGYLYAYLASAEIGYPMITRTISGSSVPALWPEYLREVVLVRTDERTMQNIDEDVTTAFEQRVRATALENEARACVEEAIQEAL